MEVVVSNRFERSLDGSWYRQCIEQLLQPKISIRDLCVAQQVERRRLSSHFPSNRRRLRLLVARLGWEDEAKGPTKRNIGWAFLLYP
jgi:hypothetical protein